MLSYSDGILEALATVIEKNALVSNKLNSSLAYLNSKGVEMELCHN